MNFVPENQLKEKPVLKRQLNSIHDNALGKNEKTVLKGHLNPAQGNALGNNENNTPRPERATYFNPMATP